MKFVAVAAVLFIAAVFAADEKKEEERPKTFRRLIPADVLRGKFIITFLKILNSKNEKISLFVFFVEGVKIIPKFLKRINISRH